MMAVDLLVPDIDNSVHLHSGQMDVDICRFDSLATASVEPNLSRHFGSAVRWKYLPVYNTKAEDVKHSLRPEHRRRQAGEKVDRFGRFSDRWSVLLFKVNLDIAACGRLWISVTSMDTKLETF